MSTICYCFYCLIGSNRDHLSPSDIPASIPALSACRLPNRNLEKDAISYKVFLEGIIEGMGRVQGVAGVGGN